MGPQGVQGSQGTQGLVTGLVLATQINFQQWGGGAIAYFGVNSVPAQTPTGPNGAAAYMVPGSLVFSNMIVGLDSPAPPGGIQLVLFTSADDGVTYGQLIGLIVTIPAGARSGSVTGIPTGLSGRLVARVQQLGALVNVAYGVSLTLT